MRHRIMQVESLIRPVITAGKCTGCKTCIKHCKSRVLVYERATGRMGVKDSRGCSPECRTCARLCPTGAITFSDEEAFVRYLNRRLEKIKHELAHVDNFLAQTGLNPG